MPITRPVQFPKRHSAQSGAAPLWPLRAGWCRRAPDARTQPVEVGGDARRVRRGVGREQDRGPWSLAEVEIVDHVAQDLLVLADVGSRIGSFVGLGIEPGPTQEVVLDELEVDRKSVV